MTDGGPKRVLGIEGTAWAASAAIYDVAANDVTIETEAYQPESGGIHPREAAEHMAEHVPAVVERALAHARDLTDEDPPVDCVAFSRGPGLGPCLRIAGTAARALAQRLDVPLVGVNHMVAHLEIGRHLSGFQAPICLNASGANAHVLGFRAGRYRVLGETMDTGVGNAIDKFTRHVGWSHPGGPKVEAAARGGEYVDLPYVVKGMDFSFSGIMSAAKEAYDDGVPVEDVCFSLQENIFAMLTEVSERALSLTGRDELVLGGGVGQNERLQAMLTTMCEQRGADLFVPENRFLGDNAGMIAVLGAKMFAAGETLAIEESAIDADFRPDEVPVTWREPEAPAGRWTDDGLVQGAEAIVSFENCLVRKRRLPREYRHPTLDARLRRERTRQEARLTSQARRVGVPTPVVRDIDLRESELVFAFVGDSDLRADVTRERVERVATHLARIHESGFVHGDPTTRNVRIESLDDDSDGPGHDTGHDVGDDTGHDVGDDSGDARVYLIDFGLGYYSSHPEDHAMDLHVLIQSLAGTADDAEELIRIAKTAYERTGDPTVVEQLVEIEARGRYQ